MEDGGYTLIWYDDGGILVVVVLFKQSAVKVWHVADEVFQKPASVYSNDIDFVWRVKPEEEEGLESLVIKVLFRRTVSLVCLPQGGQIIGVRVELEPAFLLDKRNEHEPVEQPLRE